MLGLGSNLGDRAGHLRRAVAALRARDRVMGISPVYATAPLGGPAQGEYLNLAVELDTARSARELLALCMELEDEADRDRTQRWGPRTLDVDVLWIEGVSMAEADLEVPHPRMRERRFVLAPLADLAPDLVGAGEIEAAEGEVARLGPLESI
jgi:2-amino-4-hydroxy-6-hydroxymethyldihydropteridine diphosphokinase